VLSKGKTAIPRLAQQSTVSW